MKDRVPVYPGRVKMVPVSGQENVYDMTRADQPTQQGDPLNKATLLKDATAALFGLGTDAVPDDVLAYVGKYAQHWWKRRIAAGERYVVKWSDYTGIYALCNASAYEGENIQYIKGSDVIVNADGELSLTDPVSLEKGYLGHDYEVADFVNGEFGLKPFRIVGRDGNMYANVYIRLKQPISRKDVKINAGYWSFKSEFVYQKASAAKEKIPAGEWEYVQSSSRSTYPDSGEQDGYEYQYLGIPFENAATAPKIATGSYVGTGRYGSSNPNSLTFDFIPALILIFSDATPAAFFPPRLTENFSSSISGYEIMHGTKAFFYSSESRAKFSGTTLSWYYAGSDASISYQLNVSGKTYPYIALG